MQYPCKREGWNLWSNRYINLKYKFNDIGQIIINFVQVLVNLASHLLCSEWWSIFKLFLLCNLGFTLLANLILGIIYFWLRIDLQEETSKLMELTFPKLDCTIYVPTCPSFLRTPPSSLVPFVQIWILLKIVKTVSSGMFWIKCIF